MKKLIVCIILSHFICASINAQPVTATVDTSQILIGEKINLQLRAFFTSGQKPEWFSIDTIPHFEIMHKFKIDTQLQQQDVIITQSIIITSWDSGRWNIPAFTLASGSTQPITINVTHTPFDYTQPYNDIHDIVDVKTTSTSNWYWYFLAAILLITILMLIFPAKKKDKTAATEIDPGAYKKAMNRLNELKSSGVAESDLRKYYTELSHIFRSYVHGRTGIYSFQRTTTDLAVQLQQLALPKNEFNELVQALKMSDLVKYAKYQPLQMENKQAFDTISKSITSIEDVV